jgi:hypothetical protein
MRPVRSPVNRWAYRDRATRRDASIVRSASARASGLGRENATASRRTHGSNPAKTSLVSWRRARKAMHSAKVAKPSGFGSLVVTVVLAPSAP